MSLIARALSEVVGFVFCSASDLPRNVKVFVLQNSSEVNT